MDARLSDTTPSSGPRPGASTRSSWSGTTCGIRYSTGTRLMRAEASARPRMSSRGPFPLEKLRHAGDKDAGAIIRAWNNEASRQQQLVGGKAQALRNVLGLMPADVFMYVMLPAVSELSWEKSPWSDAAFSNKRIYPGATPVGRSSSAAWRTRLKVTDESM